MDYDAFISYRRSDGARVARWLRRELQSFRMPKPLRARFSRAMKVYLDTAYERATSDFYLDTIHPALMASRYLILVVTPDMLKPRSGGEDWVLREIADFSAGPNVGNILVARAAGEFDDPLPGSLTQDFPNIEIVDLRGAGRLNLVNTFRLGRLTAEKLKIVAAVMNMPPDAMPALRQEQERAQQARIGLIAGGASAIAVGVSGLAIYALQSAWRAEEALARSQQTTSRVVSTILTLPEADGIDNARAVALAMSCDLYDQLSDESTERQEPSIAVTCALERANAFEVHKDFHRAERALRFAVSVATKRRADFTRGNADSSTHDARMALAHFLLRREQLPEVRRIAQTVVDAATKEVDAHQPVSRTATDQQQRLMPPELVGALTRRISAGAFLAERQAAAGETQAAITTYAALDPLIQKRERVRLATEVSNATDKGKRSLSARERAVRARYARRRAKLLRAYDMVASNAALDEAITRLRETEKLSGIRSVTDLSIASVLTEQVSLSRNGSGDVARTATRDEIRQRLERVWKSSASSGKQRRRARTIWRQVRKLLKQPAAKNKGTEGTSN